MSEANERALDAVIAEADEAVRQAEYERAVSMLQAGLQAHPDDVRLSIRLGQAARLAGDLEQSLQVLQRAAELAPNHYDVLDQLGTTMLEEADIWGALTAHSRMVELYPDDDDGRFVLSMTQTALGRPDLALPEVEAVIASDPDRARYRVGHGVVLNRLGRHTEAIDVLDDVVARRPRYLDAWLGLAEAYRRLQRTESWVAAARQAEALKPESPAVQVWLYDVALAEGRPQEGAGHLKRAIELHPRYFLAHIAIGTFAWNARDLGTAESWLESAVQIAPWDGRAQGVLAQFRAETGRGNLDLDHLEGEALALPYGRLPLYLGQLYLRTRPDVDRAVRFLDVAVAHAPDGVEARTDLGNALVMRRDFEAAMVHYQRAIDLSPEYGPAWFGLGFARYEQGNFAEAVEVYARAAALLPRQANVRQGYGVTLLDLGRVQEALPELRAAAELEPQNGKILYSLARGLDQAGRADEALETVRRARSLPPDDPQIAELADRLQAPSQPQSPRDGHPNQDAEDQRR